MIICVKAYFTGVNLLVHYNCKYAFNARIWNTQNTQNAMLLPTATTVTRKGPQCYVISTLYILFMFLMIIVWVTFFKFFTIKNTC